jgi:hypothetical protein
VGRQVNYEVLVRWDFVISTYQYWFIGDEYSMRGGGDMTYCS